MYDVVVWDDEQTCSEFRFGTREEAYRFVRDNWESHAVEIYESEGMMTANYHTGDNAIRVTVDALEPNQAITPGGFWRVLIETGVSEVDCGWMEYHPIEGDTETCQMIALAASGRLPLAILADRIDDVEPAEPDRPWSNLTAHLRNPELFLNHLVA